MAKKSKKGRRKISSAKVKENLDKKQFQHPYIKLPTGMDFFIAQFEKGKTTRTYKLNVIPFEAGAHNKESAEGELWWRSKYEAAKKVGPEEVSVASPRSIGKKDPMYDAWKAMADDPDIDDEDIKDLRPKTREIYYVQDTDDDSGKIFMLDISYYLFGKKLDEELRSEDGEDNLAFADIEDGCTLKLRFKQSKFGQATYQEVDKVDFVRRVGEEVTDEIIDSITDPINTIKFLPPSEIKKIMEGDEDGDDEIPMEHEGDAERFSKAKKKSKVPAKKKKKKKKEDTLFENLENMDRSALKKLIKSEDLDIRITKSKTDGNLRKEIISCHGDDADW